MATESLVLGPLEVRHGGRAVAVPAGEARVLLATLLLRAGGVVAVDAEDLDLRRFRALAGEGGHAELRALTREHPFDERFWALLVRAPHRSGRTSRPATRRRPARRGTGPRPSSTP
ncbi:BTAD domain-containing putative transcriptional regulator [Saccharothrix sp. Mg75]|uniref:BTAD domain-containing putative transcriptional regulator n=1 Tax=Saccharothrix sp. Mg75 TaxID=3445357 RepID=UPI003EE92DB9